MSNRVPFCKDCKHYYEKELVSTTVKHCHRNKPKDAYELCLITGDRKEVEWKALPCESERYPTIPFGTGACGKDAMFFEEKD